MRYGSRARPRPWRALVMVVVVATAVCAGTRSRGVAQSPGSGTSLRQVATFELPGPPGKRFDYLTFDDSGKYLFSAHLGAGLLHVIDVRVNAVAKTVPGVPGVEGVAYIGEGRKLYTSNWGENKIGVI